MRVLQVGAALLVVISCIAFMYWLVPLAWPELVRLLDNVERLERASR